MAEEAKKRGRPPVWQTRIKAPPAALELYELLASLQNSDAFQSCHVYEGTVDKQGIPMFRFEGKVHAMPQVITSFMGLEYGVKNCGTPGCMNPFHYTPPPAHDRLFDQPAPQLAENNWTDLIDYYVEDVGIKFEYEALRNAIPAEDITDSNLLTAIQNYKP